MTGNSVALDTNVAIGLLNDEPPVVAWLNTFNELYLPSVVLGELMYGALNSSRPAENMARVGALVMRCAGLSVTAFTSEAYARIRLQLKTAGRPVPANDLWIAATCVERQLPLATDDAHFNVIADLDVLAVP